MLSKLLIFMLMLWSVGPTVLSAAGEPTVKLTIDDMNRYVATVTGTGVGSNVTVALALPVGGARRGFLEDIVVTSPTATTVTIGYGATSPTGGAISASGYWTKNGSVGPTAIVYGPATGQGAAAFSLTYPISASVPQPYNMRGSVLSSGKVDTRTVLVTLNAPTGAYQFVITWGEK